MAMNLHHHHRVGIIPELPPCRNNAPRAPLSLALRPRSGANLRIVRAVGGGGKNQKAVQNSNYVVPIDESFSSANSSLITRPLAEILRDLNKRVPENVVKAPDGEHIPWYHANRMLSFYAPGWCGEVRDVIFSDDGSVTVVYRVTVRGSDGEAHRESTGTISSNDRQTTDPVTAAEEIAFCKACARFGLGLHLYHEE